MQIPTGGFSLTASDWSMDQEVWNWIKLFDSNPFILPNFNIGLHCWFSYIPMQNILKQSEFQSEMSANHWSQLAIHVMSKRWLKCWFSYQNCKYIRWWKCHSGNHLFDENKTRKMWIMTFDFSWFKQKVSSINHDISLKESITFPI